MHWPWNSAEEIAAIENAKEGAPAAASAALSTVNALDYCRTLPRADGVPPLTPTPPGEAAAPAAEGRRTDQEPLVPVLAPHAPLRPDQAPRILKPEVHQPAEWSYPKVEGTGFVGGIGTHRKDN